MYTRVILHNSNFRTRGEKGSKRGAWVLAYGVIEEN